MTFCISDPLLRSIRCITPLLLVLLVSAPAQAEQESAQGQVLTMTGLKRDSVKTVTETMKFYGLRRQSPATSSPPSSEKNNK